MRRHLINENRFLFFTGNLERKKKTGNIGNNKGFSEFKICLFKIGLLNSNEKNILIQEQNSKRLSCCFFSAAKTVLESFAQLVIQSVDYLVAQSVDQVIIYLTIQFDIIQIQKKKKKKEKTKLLILMIVSHTKKY